MAVQQFVDRIFLAWYSAEGVKPMALYALTNNKMVSKSHHEMPAIQLKARCHIFSPDIPRWSEPNPFDICRISSVWFKVVVIEARAV
jgi:hypothetical protein